MMKLNSNKYNYLENIDINNYIIILCLIIFITYNNSIIIFYVKI